MDDAHVEATFPELDAIDDPELRAGVVAAWRDAATDAGVTDLDAVPWLPPVERDLGIVGEERLVDHVRDVTACARALAATLADRRGADVDRDLLVAGALVHDVSKLAEFDGHESTPWATRTTASTSSRGRGCRSSWHTSSSRTRTGRRSNRRSWRPHWCAGPTRSPRPPSGPARSTTSGTREAAPGPTDND
jgi:hypothetical protein